MKRVIVVRTPGIAWVYLGFSFLGLATTMTYNWLAIRELGWAFTPAAFVRSGFEGSPILGSLASDFWVGSAASVIWMAVEGVRTGMRRVWLYLVLTFLVAWAFALPLFLFARERHMARTGGSARFAADRLAGRVKTRS